MDIKKLNNLVKEIIKEELDVLSEDQVAQELADELVDLMEEGDEEDMMENISSLRDAFLTEEESKSEKWNSADEEKKEEFLLTAVKDPDDIDQYLELSWEDLPPEVSSNMTLDEARQATQYKLTGKLSDAIAFLERVNDLISKKLIGTKGRGRKAVAFSPEDMERIKAVLSQPTFTSQDMVDAIERFNKVQPVNAILQKMGVGAYEDKKTGEVVKAKGYIEPVEVEKEEKPKKPAGKRGRPAAKKADAAEEPAVEKSPEDFEAIDIPEFDGTTQKQLEDVKATMKKLAKQYKEGNKSVVADLKDLTAKKKELEAQLDDEVSNLQEDLGSITDVALGVAGGLVGLYSLARGAAWVKHKLGDVAYNLSQKTKKQAREAAMNQHREDIKSIIVKFENDSQLASMYEMLPEEMGVERTNQLKDIADYIKSKLNEEELEYFTDISSMLRTGDLAPNRSRKADGSIAEINDLQESKKSNKNLLFERFQKLANIKK